MESKSLNEKLGFDFIYSSAQIEGNTYTKAETLYLLDLGITAGGKKDAKMILNLKNAYNTIILQDVSIDKESLCNIHAIVARELVQTRNWVL